MIERLDFELQSYAAFLKKNYNFSTDFMGAGAAGGTPASVLCFLNATLKSGIEAILEAIHFDEQIRTADVVFTGEGRLDTQSLKGKAVYGIASHCHQMQIPCIAIVGQIKGLEPSSYPPGLTEAFAIVNKTITFQEALTNPKKHLYDTTTLALKCFLKKYKQKSNF
jgi:glycerate kinase